MIDFDSPRAIRRLLEERNLSVKKRFGQNFLINRGAREKIIKALQCESDDAVWEIGPGIGSLTGMLLNEHVRLAAFEIDYGFSRILTEQYKTDKNFSLVTGDFIETWELEKNRSGFPDRIVGNLPYSSAAAILLNLIRSGNTAQRLVFTVQKEAAQRITANLGSPAYSSFSILCRLKWSIKVLGDLRPGSFYPSPRVVSTILVCEPRVFPPISPEIIMRVTRGLFANRRKTVKNNLGSFVANYGGDQRTVSDILNSLSISFDTRPENLAEDHILSLVGALVNILPSDLGLTNTCDSLDLK